MEEDANDQVCSRCGMAALELQNGLLVCQACGTQAEDFVEETAEFQVGIDDSKRRKMRLTKRKTIIAGDEAVLSVREELKCYCRCMQVMLQAQLEALVSHFGVQPSDTKAALPIWTAMLAQSGLLSEENQEQMETHALGKQMDDNEDSKHRKRPLRAELRDSLTVLLPPHTLLVICLLVCWLSREAVSHVDLIRGALLGHIPFLDMPARCKDLLQTPAGQALPLTMMKSATPYGLINAQTLLNKAAETAADLELKLPPLNAALVIERTLVELAMPQALLAPAMAMYRCYREGTIYMRLFEIENRSWTSPHIYAMAVLIVTIKIVYGLDGLPRHIPLGLPAAPSWLQWAQSVLDRLQGPLHPAPSEQGADMSSAELLQYKQYLQRYVFAGWQAPDDLKEWVRLLEHHISHSDMATEGQLDAMSSDDLQELNPEPVHANLQPSEAAAIASTDGHPYLFTSEYRRMTRDKVTPDYAAVLLVCSRYLWISPMQLHTEVAQLESEMLEVEAAVSSAAG